jgi:hypothetical protein
MRALSGFGSLASGVYFRHGHSRIRHFPTRRATFHLCCGPLCSQCLQIGILGFVNALVAYAGLGLVVYRTLLWLLFRLTIS